MGDAQLTWIGTSIPEEMNVALYQPPQVDLVDPSTMGVPLCPAARSKAPTGQGLCILHEPPTPMEYTRPSSSSPRASCSDGQDVGDTRYLVGGPGWSGAGPPAVGMMSCLCLLMIRGRKSPAAALRQVGWLDDIIVHRRAPEDPHLQRVQIEALLTCNLSCSYCYPTSGPGRKERLSHGKLWTSSTKQMP